LIGILWRSKHHENVKIGQEISHIHHHYLGIIVMTASLTNFIWSLVWGAALVLIPATAALILISQKDKVTRRG
jgi:photosystem II PsbX protein